MSRARAHANHRALAPKTLRMIADLPLKEVGE